MNRRERRALEKKLGITKHRKSMTFDKRIESIRQNIIEGKKKQDGMKENQRVQENKDKDQAESNQIASLATELMIKNGISYIEALEEAKKSLEKIE
jgi:hypothetical protein